MSAFPDLALDLDNAPASAVQKAFDFARAVNRADPDAGVELRQAFENLLYTQNGQLNARDFADRRARFGQALAGEEATGALIGDEMAIETRAALDAPLDFGGAEGMAAVDSNTKQVSIKERAINRSDDPKAYDHLRHEVEHLAQGPMMDAINEMSPAEIESLQRSVAGDIQKRYRGLGAEARASMAEYWSGRTKDGAVDKNELARYLVELALDSPRDLQKLGLKGWRRFIPGSKSEAGATLKRVSEQSNLGLFQGARLSAVEAGALARAAVDTQSGRATTKATLEDQYVEKPKGKRKKGATKLTGEQRLAFRVEATKKYEEARAMGMGVE
jgi:hypothetical protein